MHKISLTFTMFQYFFVVKFEPFYFLKLRFSQPPFLFGITYVRGCEIEGMLDSEGKMVEEYNREAKEDGPVFTKEFVRTYRVYIDPCQYQEDLEKHTSDPEKNEDVYRTFNVILRRRPKENNFKAVLDTIRQLMNSQAVVPEWLHDTLLGYGDPGKCHYTQMNNTVPVLNWNDTEVFGRRLFDEESSW